MIRVAEHFSASDTGRQRRANEDDYLARAPLFVVADGMGGARAGEVASHTAVSVFQAGLPPGSPEEALATRAREANERIHTLSQADAQHAGMGTTLTAAHVGEHDVAIAHVGDSRAYRLRDGELTRLTDDHSLVEELVRQGKLTESEAEAHPQRSIITRALGPEPSVDVDTLSHPARAGDVYLICSDGLTSMLGDDRLREILTGARDLPSAGRALIDAANAAGGRDNITVVLFRIEEVGEAAAEQPTQIGLEAVPAAAPPVATPATPAAPAAPAVPPPAEPPQARRLAPRMPDEEKRRGRRGIPVAVRVLLSVLIVAGLLLTAGYFATQAVYFIGTDPDGQVTVYHGVPFDLPGGISLYETQYISGVTAAELTPAYRRRLLDHRWRSENDATSLVHQLELGQVSQQ